MRGRPPLAAVAVAVVALGGCFSPDELEPLPAPSTVVTGPTTTAAPPADHRGVVLPPVEGTTSTTAVVIAPGAALVRGRVDGPDGPVEGATVRVERMVGDASAGLDVLTGPDGTWEATGVLGGRYRVRAWRPPDLAALEAQVLFVAGTGTADVVIPVERFSAPAVDLALAPDPPQVGQRTSVVLRIAERLVDAEGVVREMPRSGVAVSLGASSGWAAESPLVGVTGDAGTVTFILVCRSPGPQGLIATVAPDQIVPLDPPECAAPAPPEPSSASSVPPDGDG